MIQRFNGQRLFALAVAFVVSIILIVFALSERITIGEKWYASKLRSSERTVRLSAARRLESLSIHGRILVEDWYISNIKSPDEAERNESLERLRELSSTKAIPSLIAMIT